MNNPSEIPSGYISEQDASNLAGVSASTLLRFAEAGYFRSAQVSGIKIFNRQEICDVFGLVQKRAPASMTKAKGTVPSREAVPSRETVPSTSSEVNANSSGLLKDKIEITSVDAEGRFGNTHNLVSEAPFHGGSKHESIYKDSAEPQVVTESGQLKVDAPNSGTTDDWFSDFDEPTSYEATTSRDSSEPIIASGQPLAADVPTAPSRQEADNLPQGESSDSVVSEKISPSQGTQEISDRTTEHDERFKRVVELQEQLLDQQDQRIKELTQERDWLRSRLEKMEDKSDRDQMLLMVESQKVKTLIERNPNKGIIKNALGWLGFSKEEQPTNAK